MEGIMKHLILVFLVIGSVMIFFGCQEDSTLEPVSHQSNQVESALAKPTPNLIGKIVTDFTFTPPTFWNGTVDFGKAGKYGLTFISYGPPRDYSQASPFEEDFIIYKLDGDWKIPENVYIKGSNTGVVTYANKAPEPVNFLANGKIEEAYGLFEMWKDRKIHIRGHVFWKSVGVPDGAVATLRIN
jgi:hypothetical protein